MTRPEEKKSALGGVPEELPRRVSQQDSRVPTPSADAVLPRRGHGRRFDPSGERPRGLVEAPAAHHSTRISIFVLRRSGINLGGLQKVP